MDRKCKKLSIIIPVYCNENSLVPLYADLKENILEKIGCEYEIVIVNDGSRDGSWGVMQTLAREDAHIHNLSLSRNYGSHAALLCGLDACTGDCAVAKAADMQEPAELILEMLKAWEKGNNVVLAVRKEREEGRLQILFANIYYWMTRKFALPDMPKGGFDVWLLDRKVIEVLRDLDEKNSALTGQILWSGFRTRTVYYTRRARTLGKSRWTFKKKTRLVADTLFSFSLLPISLITWVGLLAFGMAFIWAVFVLIEKISGNISISGWASLMIVQLLSFGIIMITMGILGEYLWRTFDASRNRPPYIIEDDDWKRSV